MLKTRRAASKFYYNMQHKHHVDDHLLIVSLGGIVWTHLNNLRVIKHTSPQTRHVDIFHINVIDVLRLSYELPPNFFLLFLVLDLIKLWKALNKLEKRAEPIWNFIYIFHLYKSIFTLPTRHTLYLWSVEDHLQRPNTSTAEFIT